MYCANGELICNFGNMVTFSIGKCSECLGSICAKSSDDYPGESKPSTCETRKKKRGEVPLHVLVEREVMERQVSRCQAGWACACVAFDGKGYYTRGAGGQCPIAQGWVSEECTEEGGHMVSAWLRTGSDMNGWMAG
jgi:hypothetical protein